MKQRTTYMYFEVVFFFNFLITGTNRLDDRKNIHWVVDAETDLNEHLLFEKLSIKKPINREKKDVHTHTPKLVQEG